MVCIQMVSPGPSSLQATSHARNGSGVAMPIMLSCALCGVEGGLLTTTDALPARRTDGTASPPQ